MSLLQATEHDDQKWGGYSDIKIYLDLLKHKNNQESLCLRCNLNYEMPNIFQLLLQDVTCFVWIIIPIRAAWGQNETKLIKGY